MKGVIVKVFGMYYTIEHDGGRSNCVLPGRHRMRKDRDRFTEPVAVGDLVDFDPGDGESAGTIGTIHDRKNVFTRKDKGRTREDLIAANLDLIIVIQSFAKPKLNLRFVDRIIVRGVKGGIPVSLCVNKSDLAVDGDIEAVRAYYDASGVPVYITSAVRGDGIEGLRNELAGKITLFAGSSGVGKSMLLNSLFPGLNLRTSHISESTGKGRHTTTNVEMVSLPDGSRVLDTPGLREFGLTDIEPQELEGYFTDFYPHRKRCRFTPCTHDHEPGCEVKKRVEKGKLSEERYISYLNILRSLQENHDAFYS